MYKLFGLPLLLLLVTNVLFAQSDTVLKEINRQVWKPFIESFNNLDTEGFMAVHSKDMTRVIQDGKKIYGFEQYAREMKSSDANTKKGNRKRLIEFRFIQRIASNDKGFEVGYYKSTTIRPDGTSNTGYGKFHVLLRKENGIWKILMDADASEKTDEAVFQKASPLE